MSKEIEKMDYYDENEAAAQPSAQPDPATPAASENLPACEPQTEELEGLRIEVAALQDRLLRLQAEFENYRKRQHREREEVHRQAKERMLRELPAVVDNIERAIRHGGTEVSLETLVRGMELVHKQVLEILTRFGAEPMPTLGETFDPHRHEAMARVETSGDPPDGTVVEEYRRGYLLDGKVLRPALVSVAKLRGEDQERDDV